MEDVFREQYARLVRIAFLLTGSAEMAEDVAQDAFVELGRRWSTVQHPAAYVRAAVVNRCRSALRRRRLERDRQAMTELQTQENEVVELRDSLLRLPYRQRAAIVLRFYAGLSDEDIALMLGCRPATVRSLVHRALAQLREEVVR